MTTTEILTGIKNWVLSKLSLKQDVISDLATIRSGAQAGTTAVQPSDLSEYFNDASYDTSTHRINFYHGQDIVAYVDASPFIVDGMVDDVRIENGYLVIDFNTDSGKQDISIPLTDIFDPSNYYNKTQTDTLLGNKVDKVSGKGLSTNDYTNAEKEKLSGLQNYDDTQVRQLIGQKQDIIQDLDTIRSGASAGATAVQPATLNSALSDTVAESGVYDVTANNNNAKFASLSALLSSENLDTLIPSAKRKGGMSIKFVLSSDNKYIQARCMADSFTTDVAYWQGVDDEINQGSKNIIESGTVFELDSCVVDGNINMEFTSSYAWNITQGNTIERAVSSYGSQMSCSKGFITVTKGQKYNVSTVVLGAAKKVILTDEAGNVISSYNYNANTAEVVIPNGATRMYINKATNEDFSVSVYNIKYYIEKLLTDLSTITPTVLSDNKNLNNLLSSIGLVNQELTLSTGFYEANLAKNTSTGWKCAIVDIENYDGLIIYASVRGNAYVSLTDSENNILWQSNSSVLYKEVDKSSYPTATKLYLSNDTSALENPFVFGSKFPNKLISISRLESAINNLPTLVQPIIDKELYGANIPFSLTSGFYKKDLTTGSSGSFKKSVVSVNGYKEILIHASVRGDAYVSLVDANNVILWQSNSINDTVLDFTNFPTANKLYLSNETSVIANPYVKGLKKITYDIEQLEKKTVLLGSNRLAHVSFDDVHYCLEDITINANSYDSLFDSLFFSTIRELHQNYGMVFSLFVFQTATAADGVSTWHLSDVTNKFASEFSANSDWLRFGMHTGDYGDFVDEIIRITGNPECIDMVPRFDSFAGSLSYCQACRDSDCGIIGLLCADDNRNSYYLSSELSALVHNKGKYFDADNQLFFFRTLTRLEGNTVSSILNPLMTQSGYNISNNAIIFTHEYEFFDSNFAIITNRLIQLNSCGKWCNSHGYYWGFLMDKIRKTF